MSEYRGYPQKKNDKNFSILSRFLSKITPKERDTNKSFHDRIDQTKDKMINCFASNPFFSDLVKYSDDQKVGHNTMKGKKKKNLHFFKRNLRKASSIDQSDSMNTILKSKNQNELSDKKQIILKRLDSKVQEKQLPSIFQCSSERNILKPKSQWINQLNEDNPIKVLIEKGIKESSKNSKNTIDTSNNSIKKNSVLMRNNESGLKSNKIQFFQLIQKEIKKKEQLRSLSVDPKFRINKFNTLLAQCDQQIGKGKSLDNFIEKNNDKITEDVSTILKAKNNLNHNAELDLLTKLDRKKTKYDLMHEKSMKEIKKRLYFTVSAELAYMNRKEYIENIKHPNRDEPYEIYLRELNSINDANMVKKENEKNEIMKIESILDDTIKDKEFLKAKIQQQQMNYHEIFHIMKKNGEYYPLNNEFFLGKKVMDKKIKPNSTTNNHKSFEKISLQVFDELSKKYHFK